MITYVWDNHHHGDLRDQAETALAWLHDPSVIAESGGQEHLLALVRKDDETEWRPFATENENGLRRIELDTDEFEREVARLTGDSGGQGETMPRSNPSLRETESAFVYEEALRRTAPRPRTRSVRRPLPRRAYGGRHSVLPRGWRAVPRAERSPG